MELEKEEEHKVSKKDAMEHAMTKILLGIVTKTPRLEKWEGARISPEPLEIYDINGQLLFYEFSVERGEKKDKKMIGRIKASASKVLGPAVYSIEIGPRLWNADKATKEAITAAERKYKGAKIISTQLVCYSYPKIGILVALEDPETKKRHWIVIDVATYEIVPILSLEEAEGTGIWSLYDSIPHKDRRDRILRWEADDRLRKLLREAAEKARKDLYSVTLGELQHLEKLFLSSSKLIPLTLHGQEHCVWCAPATGQMLLRYYSYFYDQNDIVNAMGTVWDPACMVPPYPPCIGGTTNAGQVVGYESLSRNYINAVLDLSPTWSKAKSEIDQDRPLKSGIRWVTGGGHARACSGYMSVVIPGVYAIEDTFGRRIFVQHDLYICDPWPPDPNNAFCNPQGGQEGWEPWDALDHVKSNFIYLRPCTGTMVCLLPRLRGRAVPQVSTLAPVTGDTTIATTAATSKTPCTQKP